MDLKYRTVQSGFMNSRESIKYYCNNQAKKMNGKLDLMKVVLVKSKRGIVVEGRATRRLFLESSRE
jgi:hypothetical protein